MITFTKIFTGFILGIYACAISLVVFTSMAVIATLPLPTPTRTPQPAPTFTPTPTQNAYTLEYIGGEIQETLLEYREKKGDTAALSARLKVLGENYNVVAPIWRMPLLDVEALTHGVVTGATPFPQVPGCQCTADVYNCKDFPLQNGESAQGCFEYCIQLGFGDVHGLDRNSNNLVCEDN